MRGKPSVIACLGLMLAAAVVASLEAFGQTPTLSVAAGDAMMVQATERARSTLPSFWEALASPKPDESRFALKVAFDEDDKIEQIWITQVERHAGRVTGRINNKPAVIKTLELEQRVEASEDDISDWLFMRNGKIVGNETLKALFSRLPADKAAYFRSLHESE